MLVICLTLWSGLSTSTPHPAQSGGALLVLTRGPHTNDNTRKTRDKYQDNKQASGYFWLTFLQISQITRVICDPLLAGLNTVSTFLSVLGSGWPGGRAGRVTTPARSSSSVLITSTFSAAREAEILWTRTNPALLVAQVRLFRHVINRINPDQTVLI